ncbi:uncharacterized protein LOC121967104 isoform X2 [Zingiber officinale]|uniref:uncharacterized protein LOC121967104 isoform X2 n=1 Tax=Zingiber officinale TaxID=94328 RepID=UPI001C4CA5C9|nr:uncharacterized protein LOC121967104 isoform X2 [Zingiber officinale]
MSEPTMRQMEGETKRNDLDSLIKAIKSSNALECQISLLSQLGNFDQSADQTILLQYLSELWDDSTCLSQSQCVLNKTILSIVSKYLEADISGCASQFIVLGTKANKWCERHLNLILHSNGASQDENLSVMFSQKIPAIASEVLKLSQVISDAAVKLCRTYFQAIKLETCGIKNCKNNGSAEEELDIASHVIDMVVSTIKYLYDLGLFAASGGGSLVTLLNVSWKGVVSLLQLAKGYLSGKIDVADIILNLVSMAIESLRCAAEAWSLTLNEKIASADAKRTFLPIKFYLINAVRISSDYPHEALAVHRDLISCSLLILSLGISFSKDAKFRAASETLAEFLEPTSLLLLHTLLNTSNIKLESRLLILDALFCAENDPTSTSVEDVYSSARSDMLGSIFLVNCDNIFTAEAVKIGRLVLFLNLFKTSAVLKEEIVVAISGKLELLLDMLMHEEVYSLALGLEIPLFCGLAQGSGVTWQPMFSFILLSLKTFMIISASYSTAWMKVEAFLFENIFHPHFLCLEIITEMWCFLLSHAETSMSDFILDRVGSILKLVASSDPNLGPLSVLRKISRLVCILLSYVSPASIDRFYNKFFFSEDNSNLTKIVSVALLMEGFPLDLLVDDSKLIAIQKLVTSFYHFIESKTNEQALLRNESDVYDSSNLGLPVHALSSALQCSQVKDSDIADDENMPKIVNFAVLVIHEYRSTTNVNKYPLAKLLSAILFIISSMRNHYGSLELEKLIVELRNLVGCPTDVDDALHHCMGSISSFIASLSYMEIAEDESQTLCRSIWDLYHMLLRERHWAIAHLALVAFSYFAAHTSCAQLWRFVPREATLSFDTCTGTEASEDRFMSELKCVLEKSAALHEVVPAKELLVLVQEGTELRRVVAKLIVTNPQVSFSKQSVNHDKNKKRKLVDRISEGIGLLQNGLKVMNNALDQSDATDLKNTFSPHVSSLEDMLSHLTGLTNRIEYNSDNAWEKNDIT